MRNLLLAVMVLIGLGGCSVKAAVCNTGYYGTNCETAITCDPTDVITWPDSISSVDCTKATEVGASCTVTPTSGFSMATVTCTVMDTDDTDGTYAIVPGSACFNFGSEISLQNGYTCTKCSGSLQGECTSDSSPTCAAGHHTYNPKTGTCSACFDFSGEASVVGSATSCTKCDGISKTQCKSTQTCSAGHHTYDPETGTCSACFDFSGEASVDGSATSCTKCKGKEKTECTSTQTCAAGHHTYDAETGTCSECTRIDNARSGATYNCKTADDSDVSGCEDGYYRNDSGQADVCKVSVCSKPTGLAAGVHTDCPDGGALGTVCDFGCTEGYSLSGSHAATSTCTVDNGAITASYQGHLVVCTETSCAAYEFGAAVIGGDADPCFDQVVLMQGTQCSVNCGAGYVDQSRKVKCPLGAAQDALATGGITACVANKCAPYGFVTGVVGSCTDGLAMEQDTTCSLKCGPGYVEQTTVLSCAAGAQQGDLPSGRIEECHAKTYVKAFISDERATAARAQTKSVFLNECSESHTTSLQSYSVVCEDFYETDGRNIIVFSGQQAAIFELRKSVSVSQVHSNGSPEYDFMAAGKPGACLVDQYVYSNTCLRCPTGRANAAGDQVTSVDSDCHCTNKPSPYMDKIGVTCSEYQRGMEQRCNKSQPWRKAMSCRQSCFDHGFGYSGDDCTDRGDYLIRHLGHMVDELLIEVSAIGNILSSNGHPINYLDSY